MWNNNKHVKQEGCETSGKYLRKWLKSWIMFYLGAQTLPENRASGANIQHTSKCSSNWHVNPDWCETSGKCLKKLPKSGILTYFWAPKFLPRRLIFSTHLKVLATSWGPCSTHRWKYSQWTCEATLMWNQWKLLRKWPNSRILTFFGVQNGPEIGPQRPIFYTSLKVAPMSI